MKDVSVGQYIPGDTFLYRLDPRTKILATLLFTIALFCTRSVWSYLTVGFWLGAAIFGSGLSLRLIFRGLKGVIGLIVVTALFSVFFTEGTPYIQWNMISVSREGLFLGAEIVVRFVLLIAGASLLTYTTSPLSLLDGISLLLGPFRRVGVPAHELAMMMSIALRFVPIMAEEAQKLMSAQTARGADFESGNLFQRAKALAPLIVPLLLNAWKRADELSVAMEARCYHGGEGRTQWRKLQFARLDHIVLTTAIVLTSLVLGLMWV